MADADAHAGKFVAEVRRDGAQAIVPGVAAPGLQLDLGRRQVELVVEDVDVAFRNLEIAARLANRAAAVVHEGLRLQQHHALARNGTLAGEAMEALLPRAQSMPLGDALDRHETDVVALPRILAARVAETDEELHGATFAAGLASLPRRLFLSPIGSRLGRGRFRSCGFLAGGSLGARG